jgi:hypothetical protein
MQQRTRFELRDEFRTRREIREASARIARHEVAAAGRAVVDRNTLQFNRDDKGKRYFFCPGAAPAGGLACRRLRASSAFFCSSSCSFF